MDTELLRMLTDDFDRFAEIAVSMEWVDTKVTHIEETKAHVHQWAIITSVRFANGYIQEHFSEAYVQARITHLGCTEEWGSDFYKVWMPDDKMVHLRNFQDEYTEFELNISEITAEKLAQEITDHCKNPAIAEGLLPLLMQGESVYIGVYRHSINWDYLCITDDTITLITLSVAA